MVSNYVKTYNEHLGTFKIITPYINGYRHLSCFDVISFMFSGYNNYCSSSLLLCGVQLMNNIIYHSGLSILEY